VIHGAGLDLIAGRADLAIPWHTMRSCCIDNGEYVIQLHDPGNRVESSNQRDGLVSIVLADGLPLMTDTPSTALRILFSTATRTLASHCCCRATVALAMPKQPCNPEATTAFFFAAGLGCMAGLQGPPNLPSQTSASLHRK
jgi:hypothetical protein